MLPEMIREDIRALTAYAVADVPENFIKLDAMELPYRFPPELSEKLAAELATAQINYYPNPATCGLQAALRQTFNIPESARIALGNGSDELIQLITMLMAKPGSTMLAIEPSFVMYRHNAALYGMKYVGVPLNADFTLNLPAVLEAIREHRPSLIFLAYPNNPTGVVFQHEEVQAVIEAAPGLVVIDEAYGAFSSNSFLPNAGSVENLIVLRTLSKVGFAGLRLGYASGSPVVMNELVKIVPPYNMNQLSLTAAKFALKHFDWVLEKIALLKTERARLTEAFRTLPNAEVFPSEANFITVRLPDAPTVFNALKENGILIKKLDGTHPLLSGCLRFTVGTPEQNQAVLKVLKQTLK